MSALPRNRLSSIAASGRSPAAARQRPELLVYSIRGGVPPRSS